MRLLKRAGICFCFTIVALPAAQSVSNFPELTRSFAEPQSSAVSELNLAKTRPKPVLVIEAVTAQADADRGCCVWKTQAPKCSYTNRKYCETKANELKVKYEFHKDKVCKEVGACPAPSLR